MAFVLPKLQGRLPIVDRLGNPAAYFLRFLNVDFSGAIERQEAAQAQLIASLAQAVADIQAAQAAAAAADAKAVVAAAAAATADGKATTAIANAGTALTAAAAAEASVDGLADGTTAFTGFNVGGDNKVAFLGKVTGNALSDPTGLAASVVQTAAIAADAVTQHDYDFTAASVSCDTATPVILATEMVTLAAGEAVALSGNCTVDLTTTSGATGYISLFRDGVEIPESIRIAAGLPGGVRVAASATALFTDEPGAGTFTYTLRGYVDLPGNVSAYGVSYRYLGATKVKR